MAEIPENTLKPSDVVQWGIKKAELAKLQAEERVLRSRIFSFFFKAPKEGANKYDLGTFSQEPGFAGYDLKADYPIERKIDPVMLEQLKTATVGQMREELTALGFQLASFNDDAKVIDAIGLKPDVLVRYKPELETRVYRTLTEEQRKVFDRVLEIKPGSPQVKIEPNAATKKQLEVAAAPKAPDLPVSYTPEMAAAVAAQLAPAPVDVTQHGSLTPHGDPAIEVPVFTQLKPPF